MFTILTIMFAGILCGRLTRRYPDIRRTAGRLLLPVICLLLLAMGVGIGANTQVMHHLSTLGLQALIITVGAVAGTILCAWIVYTRFFRAHHEK